jgi:isopenicillin N synthase-like dioxygenase
MKVALDRYYAAALPFARTTLRLFSLAMGLEENALDDMHVDPLWALRCQHYPPQAPDEEANGFLAHSDFSCTLAGFTDRVGKLAVGQCANQVQHLLLSSRGRNTVLDSKC